MPAGTKLTLRMQFKNMDSIYKLNPSFSIVDRIGWLPFVRFTDPIEEYYLTVKTPAKYQAIGVGRKVSEKIEDSVEITEWTSDHPVTFPTVIFGDYVFATPKIKATKKDGSEITVNVWVDKVSTQSLDGTGINTRADVENKMRQADGGARDVLGAGCWPHHVPAVCDEVNQRAEFLTAYAGEPYEDHGGFQALFEYASMMGELLNMDVVSVPTYDGYQAPATAIRMAARLTGRDEILLSRTISGDKLSKIRDYGRPDLEIKTIGYVPETGQFDLDELRARISDKTAAV